MQVQFDELLAWVRQSGRITFKSEDETNEDDTDGPRRKTDDFDNFMEEFEQELLAKPLDQTFNAEPAVAVENMDATFCVAVPTETKKQRMSPPRRPMEAPFRVKPYSGNLFLNTEETKIYLFSPFNLNKIINLNFRWI